MRNVFCLAAISVAGVCFAATPTALAIRDARVVTVSGPILTNGTVVLRDGLIEAVGENVTVPADAWIIDGSGLNVYPGLIDALSTWGIPAAAPARSPSAVTSATPPQPPPVLGPEDRPSNTSWLRAADLIRSNDPRIKSARDAGFTTAATFPTRGIFAGQGSLVNLGGERAGDMVVASSLALYLNMGERTFGVFPGSPMGVIAYIRQLFLDAEHYRTAKAMYAKNSAGVQCPRYDRALEGILEAPLILIPVPRAVDIPRMLRFSEELKT